MPSTRQHRPLSLRPARRPRRTGRWLRPALAAAIVLGGAAACGGGDGAESGDASPATAAASPATAAPAGPATAAPSGVRLSANTATEAELMTIPGVGQNIAHEIVEYRPYDTATGPDRFRDEMRKYIDDAEIERIMQYLDFGG